MEELKSGKQEGKTEQKATELFSARRGFGLRPSGRKFDTLGQSRNPDGVVGRDAALPRVARAPQVPALATLGYRLNPFRIGHTVCRQNFPPEREWSLTRSTLALSIPLRRFLGHSHHVFRCHMLWRDRPRAD